MFLRSSHVLASGLAICLAASTAQAQLAPYSENFETLDQMDSAALSNTGWLIFGNAFDSGGGYLYGYGPFPAPNGGPGFSAITSGQGGPPQGNQQLVAYSDYNNPDHGNGITIEANVFQEQIVDASDVGKTFTFRFDAKLGDLIPNSSALAFIKVIDGTTFGLDAFEVVDTTNLPTTWGTYSISILIDAAYVGDFFQIGFSNMSTAYTPSGIVYDNIEFAEATVLGTNYCVAAGNSVSGSGSVMSASGSTSLAAQDLTLSASSAPTQPALFYFGPNQVNLAFGNGFRCVGGTVVRFPVVFGSGGSFDYTVDWATYGGAIAGFGTVNFQCWYRDPAGGGASFNLSDGYNIVFTP